jgi:hypothetical protein
MSNNNQYPPEYWEQSLNVLKSAFPKIYVAKIKETLDGCSNFSEAFQLLIVLFDDKNNRRKNNSSRRDVHCVIVVDNEQLLSEMANMMREGKSYSADVYMRCNWVALSRHLPLQDLRSTLNQMAAERDVEWRRLSAAISDRQAGWGDSVARTAHQVSVSVHSEKAHAPCPLSDRS